MPRSVAVPRTFLSADWSKSPEKRSVHVADLAARRIRREEGREWDLAALLEVARGLAGAGPVLVGLDLALGLPAGYWAKARQAPGWRGPGSFVDWLGGLAGESGFFEPVATAREWRVDRPFFRVPAGKGSLAAYGRRVEGGLLRRIDARTGAKPMFAVSGIPGTVGSATRAFWMELAAALGGDRDFAVWPFEGTLEKLFADGRIVLAETYPGLAYGAAVAAELPSRQLLVGKTKAAARAGVCDLLEEAAWVARGGVDLGGLEPARGDEDAFDSQLTAAAVLRCAVEGRVVCDPAWVDERVEGGMVLAGPVDPAARKRRFVPAQPGASTGATPAARPSRARGRTGGLAEAFAYALELHAGQVRKQAGGAAAGEGVPYVSHLLAVAGLALEHGGDEEEAIAALLHDGPEDQGGEATLEEIRRRFGDRVAGIVADCSDAFERPKPEWWARKRDYHASLRRASRSAVLVSLADKVHNAESTRADLEALGEGVWSRFTQGRRGSLWNYASLVEIYREKAAGPAVRLLARLERALDGLFVDDDERARALGWAPERDG